MSKVATESFEKNREAHEGIVSLIKKERSNLISFSKTVEDLSFDDIRVPDQARSKFKGNLSILFRKPLVIEINPTGDFYSRIWYAETPESVKYIYSAPIVKNESNAQKLDNDWYLILIEW